MSAAGTPQGLAEKSSIVLSLVADGPCLLELVTARKVSLRRCGPGGVVVDMGTSCIDCTRLAREALESVTVSLVEVPGCRQAPAVRSRSLLIIVGEETLQVAPSSSSAEGPREVSGSPGRPRSRRCAEARGRLGAVRIESRRR